MSNNAGQQTKKAARVRRLYVAAFVLACSFGTVSRAAAQTVTPPTIPSIITPPAGNSAFLVGHAFGTQGYVCLPTGTGAASWTVNGARPQATLFGSFFGQDVQIITHFLSPDENLPTSSPQAHYPSATRPGRVLSIATRCGQSSWHRSPPAPTRVARMLARLAASYSSPSGRNRGQLAASS
jgi:Protein of unknown function (DUF3455)